MREKFRNRTRYEVEALMLHFCQDKSRLSWITHATGQNNQLARTKLKGLVDRGLLKRLEEHNGTFFETTPEGEKYLEDHGHLLIDDREVKRIWEWKKRNLSSYRNKLSE